MAVEVDDIPKIYTGNGVTTRFDYSWPLWDATHIKVRLFTIATETYSDPLTLGVDYTVHGVGEFNNAPEWYIDVAVAPPGTQKIILEPNAPITQEFRFGLRKNYDPARVEGMGDYITVIIQGLAAKVDRAFVVDAASPTTPQDLLAAISTAVNAAEAAANSAENYRDQAATAAGIAEGYATDAQAAQIAAEAAAASVTSLSSLTVRDIVQGRLTPSVNTPVLPYGTSLNSANIYFASYFGNVISLHNGTTWIPYAHGSPSLSIGSLNAGGHYLFAFQNAGTVGIEAARTDASSLTTQDGILVKSGNSGRRFIGYLNIKTNGAGCDYHQRRSAESGGATIDLWNAYNQVDIVAHTYITTDSWVYGTASWRLAGGISGAKVGVALNPFYNQVSNAHAGITSTPQGGSYQIGISIDGISPNFEYQQLGRDQDSNGAGAGWQVSTAKMNRPMAGYQTFSLMEKQISSSNTIYGANGGQFSSGLLVTYKG